MDSETVRRLADALLSGEADPRTVADAAGGDDAVSRALARWEAAPGDLRRAGQLAAALLDAAPDRPRLSAWLRRWAVPGTADRPAGPAAATQDGAPVEQANTISGAARITGPSVQARDIAGGVHFHLPAPARSLPVPHQLLPVPARFVDRERDAEVLDAIRAASVVVVSGPPGVGKTAFVSHWLHQVRGEFPDGRLYADLRGHSPGGPAPAQEVLGQFLRAYGLTDQPADSAEQAALWRSVAVDLRIAVMLDNAVSAAQVRPLLPGAPGSLVVVASRRRLTGLLADGAAFHELGLLEAADAAELLTSRIGSHRAERERDAVRLVVDRCAGLPLAICLAGARMAARPRHSVAALADALDPEDGRLDALRADGHGAVQAALDDSYAALPPSAALGYRRLGGVPFTVFGPEVVAAVCGLPASEAEAVLDELVEVSLLEDLGDERFRFHDLVRLHAARSAAVEDPADAVLSGLRRAVGWYLATATAAEALLAPSHRNLPRDYPPGTPPPRAFVTSGDALDWLSREQTQLMTALRTADEQGWNSTVWQLADALWPLWHRLRPYDLWIEAHQRGLAAALRDSRPEGVSRMLTSGGGALLNAGRPEESLTWYTRALGGARRDGDRRAEAQALHGIGRAHRMAGRLPLAAEFFRQALTLRETIGYRRGAALTRVCLGDIAVEEGRADDAVALLSVAHQELTAVRDRHDAARARAFLGRAHAARGDFGTAELLLNAALEEFHSIGSVHWQGQTMEMLGLTALDRDDASAAREWFERSLAVYLSISPRDTRRLRDRISSLDGPPGGS